jgi:hypothetical protein
VPIKDCSYQNTALSLTLERKRRMMLSGESKPAEKPVTPDRRYLARSQASLYSGARFAADT